MKIILSNLKVIGLLLFHVTKFKSNLPNIEHLYHNITLEGMIK